MGRKHGIECELAYCATNINGSANTPALATWVPIPTAKSVTVPHTRDTYERTTREDGYYKTYGLGHRDEEITFEMPWDVSNSTFAFFLDAHYNSTVTYVGMFVADGDADTAGTEGLAGNFAITDISEAQPIDGEQMASITLKPHSFVQWFTQTA